MVSLKVKSEILVQRIEHTLKSSWNRDDFAFIPTFKNSVRSIFTKNDKKTFAKYISYIEETVDEL